MVFSESGRSSGQTEVFKKMLTASYSCFFTACSASLRWSALIESLARANSSGNLVYILFPFVLGYGNVWQ